MAVSPDTIAAIATPPGAGGIGIVRISGPLAATIAARIAGSLPAPRHAAFASFRDAHGDPIDHGIVLYFAAPNSYTGEPVVELQGHGGVVVMDRLLAAALAAGARLARPGEFTERAFLNDRLDLLQAEAVADLIAAQSERAARSAMRSLHGDYSRQLSALIEQLVDLRVALETSLDFPDEDLTTTARLQAGPALAGLSDAIAALLRAGRAGARLGRGLAVVIAGAPNVGKSSLLNALARSDRAITSAIPGTTRDVIEVTLEIHGIPVRIADTAGLRDAPDDIEREGIRRAHAAIAGADVVLLVVEDGRDTGAQRAALLDPLAGGAALIVVHNKIDLAGLPPSHTQQAHGPVIALSALTGAGIDYLEQAIAQVAGVDQGNEPEFIARTRHLEALAQAQVIIGTLRMQMTDMDVLPELLAEDLRRAQQALEAITGRGDVDDLLGEIFARFCIGK